MASTNYSKPRILLETSHFAATMAPVLIDGSTHLFELLNLVFQTVDSVNQTPAGTETNILIIGCAGYQHSYSYQFDPHLKRHANLWPQNHLLTSNCSV